VKEAHLEVTFRRGRPLAAYLYLPRSAGEKSHETSRVEPGLVVDFSRRGQPIGIEITAPAKVAVSALNRVLRALGQPAVTRADLAPLRAAWRGTCQPGGAADVARPGAAKPTSR
jgi:hypothetical protein